MMNKNVWKNDVIVNEYEQEQMIMAMTDQWAQYDEQLDQLFADSSFKEQDSLIEMYKNSYAGEGTGVTAARLASESYRAHGYKVAEETAKMVLNMEDIQLRKESIGREGATKIDAIFEKVRHPPIPGQTPIPPQLLAKPSNASLFLGLASSAVSAVGFSKLSGPKPTGMQPVTSTIDSTAISQASVGQLASSNQRSLNTFNPAGREITRGTWLSPTRFQSDINTFSAPFSA
jgi:hypothetical protein